LQISYFGPLFVGLVFCWSTMLLQRVLHSGWAKKYYVPRCIMGYEKERTFMTAVSVFFSGKYRIVCIMGN